MVRSMMVARGLLKNPDTSENARGLELSYFPDLGLGMTAFSTQLERFTEDTLIKEYTLNHIRDPN